MIPSLLFLEIPFGMQYFKQKSAKLKDGVPPFSLYSINKIYDYFGCFITPDKLTGQLLERPAFLNHGLRF